MNFKDELNNYIIIINCNSKQLSDASNLSTPTISRFRNGKRTPSLKNDQLDKLSTGLYELSKNKNLNLTKELIYTTLLNTLTNNIDIENLRKKFELLINSLNINIHDLSNNIFFSESLIKKIKSGERNPSNPQIFINSLCRYIVNNYNNIEDKKRITKLINCSIIDLNNNYTYYQKLNEWFLVKPLAITNSIDNFLNYLNDFDLNEYIKTISFNKPNYKNIPLYKPTSKNYYGLEQIKQSHLDFFEATLLSKSKEDVFMFTDMPIEDLAKDVEFIKKWMSSIALILKKGININIIHDINRPIKEIMIGLQSWIPLYMTGQLTPYYFPTYKSNMFCYNHYVSGNVALIGHCIKNDLENAKYNLITNKIDLEYTKKETKKLLEIAKPLMEIYKIKDKDSYNKFLLDNSNLPGDRIRMLASLPIHTITNELLISILKKNKIKEEKIKEIINYVDFEKELINNVLKNNNIIDKIEELDEESFNNTKTLLFLANSFCEESITYTFEDYQKHLSLTKEFASSNHNYYLKDNNNHSFRNIQITILKNHYVMISKNISPSIHFIIKNSKLRSAIENFNPPIIEKQ